MTSRFRWFTFLPLALLALAALHASGDPPLVDPSLIDTALAEATEPVAVGAVAVPLRISDADPPAVTARYIAIVDQDSGAMLFGQGPDVQVPPASVTKIATTMVALQREPNISRVIPISVDGGAMAARDGSQVMGLEPGEQLRLETLLNGMMLWSGNDAAEQVAVALGDGSIDRYVGWMNDLVVGLGLRHTHFVNPHGMDTPGHYSSASDMAYLARYAMQNATFRRLAQTRRAEAEGYILPNINHLLENYPGADGVKIGFTDEAGRTIVASATRDGHRVYVSLMHSGDLVGDSSTLLDWVWRTFSWSTTQA